MRWKLILASVLVEAIMLVALVWNGLRLTDESLQRQAETRLGEISVLLNAALGPALAMQDYAPAADVFKQSRRPDGIQYFVLTDPRGKRCSPMAGLLMPHSHRIRTASTQAKSAKAPICGFPLHFRRKPMAICISAFPQNSCSMHDST